MSYNNYIFFRCVEICYSRCCLSHVEGSRLVLSSFEYSKIINRYQYSLFILSQLRQRRPMCNPNTGFTFVLLRFQKALNFQSSSLKEIGPQSLPQTSLAPNSFVGDSNKQEEEEQTSCFSPVPQSSLRSDSVVVERKLLRLCAHHEKSPFLVALGVSMFEPTLKTWMPALHGGLDPRFFYILRNNHQVSMIMSIFYYI